MKTLKLAKAWDHITPEVTTAFPAGEHTVTNEIYDAAEKAGVIEEDKANGRSAPETGTKGAAGSAQG